MRDYLKPLIITYLHRHSSIKIVTPLSLSAIAIDDILAISESKSNNTSIGHALGGLGMKQVSFSEAIKKKFPEWVVLISTMDNRGRADVMPAGWAMIVSENPFMFAVAVNHVNYTNTCIRSGKEFVIGFPGPDMEEVINYCGSISGRDVDKFKETGLEALPAVEVRPPLMGGCIVNLECKLESELETGDHTTFVGRVVAAHVDEEIPGRLMNFGDGKFALAGIDNRTLPQREGKSKGE